MMLFIAILPLLAYMAVIAWEEWLDYLEDRDCQEPCCKKEEN